MGKECYLTTPAPSGYACYCHKTTAGCDGKIQACIDPESPVCTTPPRSFGSTPEGSTTYLEIAQEWVDACENGMGDCTANYPGTAALGEHCHSGSNKECASELKCGAYFDASSKDKEDEVTKCCAQLKWSGDKAKTYCQNVLEEGDECHENFQCKGGFCDGSGQCQSLKKSGESCWRGALTDYQCEDNLFCASQSADFEDKVCCPDRFQAGDLRYYCENYVRPGAACKHDKQCQNGYCDGSGKCVALKKSGESCWRPVLEPNSQCQDGLVCAIQSNDDDDKVCCPNSKLIWAKNWCTDFVAVGRACKHSDQCTGSNVCTNDKCTALLANSQACSSNGQCQSGKCAFTTTKNYGSSYTRTQVCCPSGTFYAAASG